LKTSTININIINIISSYNLYSSLIHNNNINNTCGDISPTTKSQRTTHSYN